MRRSRCYEELGRLYEAMQDLETADALDIAGLNAKREIARLKPRMEEKMEKDKDDLLGMFVESSVCGILVRRCIDHT